MTETSKSELRAAMATELGNAFSGTLSSLAVTKSGHEAAAESLLEVVPNIDALVPYVQQDIDAEVFTLEQGKAVIRYLTRARMAVTEQAKVEANNVLIVAGEIQAFTAAAQVAHKAAAAEIARAAPASPDDDPRRPPPTMKQQRTGPPAKRAKKRTPTKK